MKLGLPKKNNVACHLELFLLSHDTERNGYFRTQHINACSAFQKHPASYQVSFCCPSTARKARYVYRTSAGLDLLKITLHNCNFVSNLYDNYCNWSIFAIESRLWKAQICNRQTHQPLNARLLLLNESTAKFGFIQNQRTAPVVLSICSAEVISNDVAVVRQ